MNADALSGRILIDTNILIYATLSGDPRHEKARTVMNLRLRRDLEICISVQNLAEMYPNLTGPKNKPPDDPATARSKILSISRLSGITVLPITRETVNLALELCEKHGVCRQDYFDLQLVALMLREGIGTILSENTADFLVEERIGVLNPFADSR